MCSWPVNRDRLLQHDVLPTCEATTFCNMICCQLVRWRSILQHCVFLTCELRQRFTSSSNFFFSAAGKVRNIFLYFSGIFSILENKTTFSFLWLSLKTFLFSLFTNVSLIIWFGGQISAKGGGATFSNPTVSSAH